MKSSCLLNYDTLSVGDEHRIYLLVKVAGPAEAGGREPDPGGPGVAAAGVR